MAKVVWSEKKHMAIELGTSATRIYIEGHGLVFNEPSLIAIDNRNHKILGIGEDAKKHIGKLSKNARVHSLLDHGVVVDFKLIVLYLKTILAKYTDIIKDIYVTLAIPVGMTNVERQALVLAIKNLGCFYVDAQDGVKLALYGAGFDITKPVGRLIIDLGAGKTCCEIVASDEAIVSKEIRIGGDYIDNEIMKFLKVKKHLAVGELSAEKIKNTVGTLLKTKKNLEMKTYGYDITSGMPIEVSISESDIMEIIKQAFFQITAMITSALETAPAEIAEDVIKNGIVLTGNLAKLTGLKVYMEDFFEIPVVISKNCGTAALDGAVKYRELTKHHYEFDVKKIDDDPIMNEVNKSW